MFKLAIAVTAVLVAMSASTSHAGYKPALAESAKPPSVKSAIAERSGSGKSYSKSARGGKSKAGNKVASAKRVGRASAAKGK